MARHDLRVNNVKLREQIKDLERKNADLNRQLDECRRYQQPTDSSNTAQFADDTEIFKNSATTALQTARQQRDKYKAQCDDYTRTIQKHLTITEYGELESSKNIRKQVEQFTKEHGENNAPMTLLLMQECWRKVETLYREDANQLTKHIFDRRGITADESIQKCTSSKEKGHERDLAKRHFAPV